MREMVEKTLEERAMQADQYGVRLEPVTRKAPEPRYASHSSLVRHRVCPQSWNYSSIRKLVKVDTEDAAVERDMGSWWHMLRAADSLARGRALGSLRWVPEELSSTDDGPRLPAADVTVVQVMDAARHWWDQQPAQAHEAFAERIGEALPERLWALYTRWQNQWSREFEQERPLAVELRWERALPALPQPTDDPADERGLIDPNTILVGYVDEIYFDTRRRVIVARDHKLHKKLGTQTTADDMMDSQLQLYAWGASPTVTTWDQGSIMATAYDRARMTRPTTPVVTQMGGLSKSVSDYDVHTYRAWALGEPPYLGPPTFPGRAKDGSQAGTYQLDESVVEKLSTPAARSIWFQRTLTPLNRHVIQAHLRAAVDSAIDMQTTYARVEITHEAPRNLARKVCQFCDFAALCRSEMFGGAQGTFDLADFKLVVKPERQR